MGAISGLVGLGGGAGGTGFAGPSSGTIINPVNQGQADTAYQQSQNALGSQQALMQALQGQGGIQNQSNVYNQLQGIASGQGPNPAQATLSNATGQNIANQAALMAGQRGAGANVGLMARQAAMEGGNLQQQAVGQGASMQAQQALNAIGAAGNIAGQQVGNQMAGTGAYNSAAQSEQQNLLNAISQANNANVGMQSNINNVNAGLAQTTMGGQQGLLGGLGNAAGQGIGMLLGGGSPGKTVSAEAMGPAMKKGGMVGGGPKSAIGKMLCGYGGMMVGSGKVDVVVSPGEKIAYPEEVKKVAHGGKPELKTVPGKAKVSGDSTKNDTVPAKLPAGSVVVKRTRANDNPEGFIRDVLSKRKGKK